MNLRASIACLGLAAALAARAHAAECNDWPIRVAHTDARSAAQSTQFIGPLFFSQPLAAGDHAEGFRPFYLHRQNADASSETDFLYPLFFRRDYADGYRWSILNLINRDQPAAGQPADATRGFDLWPFYFSRQTGNPATSYRAVFPLYGGMKNRLGQDRIDWTLFPLYAHARRDARHAYSYPWPFLRSFSGGGQDGFYLWPLFGYRTQAGVSRQDFYLWPLGYHQVNGLDTATPVRRFGALPFYASERSAESVSETYLWPFFGYTDRTAPYRYHETRYLWPFLLQARGDARYRNRWAPFYSHSVIKGYDKTWVCWPLWRRDRYTEGALDHQKTQLLYFLYNDHLQQSATAPDKAPARKTHLWPLFSGWDNGAGRVQVQALSPLEVFFPHNETIRLAYSPLFALYRYDRTSPEDLRLTWLWNAISYERHTAAATSEFHLGPLFSVEKHPEAGRRIALGNGLFGLKRTPDRRSWRPFLFDFAKHASPTNPPAP